MNKYQQIYNDVIDRVCIALNRTKVDIKHKLDHISLTADGNFKVQISWYLPRSCGDSEYEYATITEQDLELTLEQYQNKIDEERRVKAMQEELKKKKQEEQEEEEKRKEEEEQIQKRKEQYLKLKEEFESNQK